MNLNRIFLKVKKKRLAKFFQDLFMFHRNYSFLLWPSSICCFSPFFILPLLFIASPGRICCYCSIAPAYVLSCFSCVQLFATPWTVAHQVPLSMGFSRQEYWSGLPFPPPEDLPDSGIELASPVAPALQVDSLPLSLQGSPKHCSQQCKSWVHVSAPDA